MHSFISPYAAPGCKTARAERSARATCTLGSVLLCASIAACDPEAGHADSAPTSPEDTLDFFSTAMNAMAKAACGVYDHEASTEGDCYAEMAVELTECERAQLSSEPDAARPLLDCMLDEQTKWALCCTDRGHCDDSSVFECEQSDEVSARAQQCDQLAPEIWDALDACE